MARRGQDDAGVGANRCCQCSTEWLSSAPSEALGTERTLILCPGNGVDAIVDAIKKVWVWIPRQNAIKPSSKEQRPRPGKQSRASLQHHRELPAGGGPAH